MANASDHVGVECIHTLVPNKCASVAGLLAGQPPIEVGKKYNCKATVIGFDLQRGWYYLACKQCTRKVKVLSSEGNMGCQFCNLPQSETVPWYRIDTMVQDSSASTVFTLLGKVGEKLIGAPIEVLINSSNTNPQAMHPQIENVIGQTRIFQLIVKENTFVDGGVKILVQNIYTTSFFNKLTNVDRHELIEDEENEILTPKLIDSVSLEAQPWFSNDDKNSRSAVVCEKHLQVSSTECYYLNL